MKNKHKINDLKKWIDERERDRNFSYNYFDKLVSTISSGGLVLSIAFIEKITPIECSSYVFFLKFSWVLFTLSLFSSLVSYFLAAEANKTEIEIANIDLSVLMNETNPSVEESDTYKKLRTKGDDLNHSINILNYTSLICLFAGVLSFMVFIFINV